jgi:GTPase SAR1 family protein
MEEGNPTTGFNMKTMPLSTLYSTSTDSVKRAAQFSGLQNKSISLKELGGSMSVRRFWGHYFQDKHAVLFVVNASASDSEITASKSVLKEVLQDEQLINKPVLILGTHADCPGARSSSQLESFFADAFKVDMTTKRKKETEFKESTDSRKWSVRCCCSFNVHQVKESIETLVDLIIETQTSSSNHKKKSKISEL